MSNDSQNSTTEHGGRAEKLVTIPEAECCSAFGLVLFYFVKRGECKALVGLASCPWCHYSLK